MNFKLKKQHLLGLLPDSMVLTLGPRRGSALYLTLDDGPHPEHTPRVLDLLAAHQAKATFFLIGQQAERHPALVERIVAEGHALGNHSWSHPVGFQRIPLQQQLHEIDRADRYLQQFDGRERHRFRPPRGSISLALMMHFIRHRRCITYWSYDSQDYRGGVSGEVAVRLRDRPPRGGEVVLMHDDDACVGDVLELLLPEWSASGRELLALPEEQA
ncbi:MAG: polysaccharide deacetylase family protein [Rhodanobacter sp.]|jgi:peptidoglycan/xylan/chitin deacetylase (PgdA/CDA1 family)